MIKTKEIIKRTFVYNRITYKINQNEGLFRAWIKIRNLSPIIENDLADDFNEIEVI